MSWNFRIIRHIDNGSAWLAIHEVFYDKDDNPDSCTQNPVRAVGEDKSEIKWYLDKMHEALEKPVIDYKYFTDKEKEVTKREHICGDPNDPCDCDCMERAYKQKDKTNEH